MFKLKRKSHGTLRLFGQNGLKNCLSLQNGSDVWFRKGCSLPTEARPAHQIIFLSNFWGLAILKLDTETRVFRNEFGIVTFIFLNTYVTCRGIFVTLPSSMPSLGI